MTIKRLEIKRLEKEITIAKEKRHQFIHRLGYRYALGGYQFDAEIEARRRFAVEWREKALDIMTNHNGTYKALYKNMWSAQGYSSYIRRKFHIFTVEGKDVLIVCPSLPSTDYRRMTELDGESAEEWISTTIGKVSYR